MRPLVRTPCPLPHAYASRRLAASVRAVVALALTVSLSGCGLMGSGQQLKQLQMENDRLLSEYRSQRERLAALQETNAALEARVGEAERLLAQVGKTLPSSRISRAPQRGSSSNGGSTPSAGTTSSNPTAPPYVPPSVPSLPDTGAGKSSDASVEWRPMRRQ